YEQRSMQITLQVKKGARMQESTAKTREGVVARDGQRAYAEPHAELRRKIADRSARLGVIGLGYVGLPLSVEMAQAGFYVTGIDLDSWRVETINAGGSYILDVSSEVLLALLALKKIKATDSLPILAGLDTVSICVPTPLRKTRDPDLSYVVAAAEAVSDHL